MSLPPSEIPLGAMRFNSDSQKLEYYDGAQWLQVSTFSPNLNGGARGVFGGGFASPTSINVINYINISSTGNAQDFGDLTNNYSFNGSCASTTRGLFAGSYPSSSNIDYITISSTGNGISFGNLTESSESISGCSNPTRGLFAGGIIYSPTVVSTNTISYVTISSTGNSVDYGDLSNPIRNTSSCASSVRGIFAGGRNFNTNQNINNINYVTIATLGNAQDFGDLTTQTYEAGGCSNATRGLFGGGRDGSLNNVNTIDYIIISSLGNSINFGDLTVIRTLMGSCSSSTRGVWGGGVFPGTESNIIDYVTILTQGNVVDFGDLTNGVQGNSACSNAHGGL